MYNYDCFYNHNLKDNNFINLAFATIKTQHCRLSLHTTYVHNKIKYNHRTCIMKQQGQCWFTLIVAVKTRQLSSKHNSLTIRRCDTESEMTDTTLTPGESQGCLEYEQHSHFSGKPSLTESSHKQ